MIVGRKMMLCATLFPFVCLFNKKARKKASGIIKTIFPKPYTKVFATLLAVSMIASMVPAAVSVQAADGDSIRLVNGKIEVDAQLKKLAEMYE